MIFATFNYKSRVDILSDSKHRFNCHICSQNRNGATFILTRNVLITIIHIQINLNAKIKMSVLFVYENSRVDMVALLTNAEKAKTDTLFERICLQKAIFSQWRVSCEQLHHAL